MRLSVLDQSMIVSGREPAASIRETLALAQLCDRLGYHRYWVSEHHNTGSIAGSAPEVLLGAMAAVTTRIRIGSAGVMLPHYSALHVAEQFRVLEALAPGRVDLGLGRAPGGDGKSAFALNPNAAEAAEYFPAQVRDLLAWTGQGVFPEAHPFRDVIAQPLGPTAPQLWILGSSTYGAQVAAHFGLPYCFGYFFSEGMGAREALALYRAQFRPSAMLASPLSAICVLAMVAESAAEAERLYVPREVWRAERERGRYVPLCTPEEAASYPFTAAEQARNAALRGRALFGTPDLVSARIGTLAAELAVDEVAVVTASSDMAARRESFALLAAAFGLPGEAGAPAAAPAARLARAG